MKAKIMLSERYPKLYQLFGAYLNQDSDLWGETIPEIVSCYRRDCPRESHLEMIHEIDSFISEHPDDLDSAFETDYGQDFDPELWGYTTASFLEELKRLLSD
ncbi:contact-dependent growth inhibition system immunity protein [Paraburkholderia sp. UCT2]|uniref:contact-dependent growth inhibition system immunity protein n=1 Tax=Paraburkholderia sp. UCT2 TaxID=2615208 RepID=UPI00292A5791|nr:contact-dependent growth inhibition system immunity protein [Paraburkholderia sp. UCT2]